ncbi:MAG: glycosyltransferase [Proteobacteria bacterium]|nr:glycosyltransferase [Pseudomonadota bacterium]
MPTNSAFSVVVSTLGRSDELCPLLSSLQQQSNTELEVIIVDQNDDDRLQSVLAQQNIQCAIKHIRAPGERGLSRGRNRGWKVSQGDYVVFADDDCWYPPELFAKVAQIFGETGADIVCGRAADEHGRSINGRYEERKQWIDRRNVWTTSIEWMVFFRRGVLEQLDGYDETIGVGAATPWQAAEGQDILLRALDAGHSCYFDPDIYGHHAELNISQPDKSMRRKALGYARGMGFVLRKHRFGIASAAKWIARPAVAALLYTFKWQPQRALYYVNVTRGRLEGFLRISLMNQTDPLKLGCVQPALRIGIGIATAGRANVLSETLRLIAKQTELPEKVVLCPMAASDIEPDVLASLPYEVVLVESGSGLTAQRNAILSRAADLDVIVFFDDDFFPEPNYLTNAKALLRDNQNIVLATGVLIEDGIHGPGLDPDIAREKLLLSTPPLYEREKEENYYGVYGCNMVVRLAPVREAHLRFDEVLPHYAWQEDIDFSRQMAPFGRIVRSPALTGIHLGTKRGRTSGVRFGYSQIANPIYLMRKGTMSVPFGLRTMVRNFGANLAKSLAPEPHVDRMGRCAGNFLAIKDIFRGCLHPSRILQMR